MNESPATAMGTSGAAGNEQTPLERCIATVCLDLIANARTRREKFMRVGQAVMRSGYSRDVGNQYAQLTQAGVFKANMPKTAIAFRVIIPSLTGPVPNRLLSPTDLSNPAAVARTEARSAYLNYTPTHTSYVKNRRLCTQEMIGYGMGVMWTGKDPRTGLVTSTYDTVRRLYLDPEAATMDDVHVVARERLLPRYDVVRMHPKQTKLIMDLQTAAKRWLDQYSVYPWEGDNRDRAKGECVRIYELYFDRGIQHFPGGRKILQEYSKVDGEPMSDEQAKLAEFKADDTPLKYTVSEEGKLIAVESWEIPFHALPTSPWPFTPLYAYSSTDSPYPISMLEPGLPYQEIMNHMVSGMMDKVRFCMKTLFVSRNQGQAGLSAESKRRVFQGSGIEFLDLPAAKNVDGKQSIKDYIEQWDWPMEWINPWLAAYNSFDSGFEQATGLSQFLITGQGNTQDRSAAASQIRDRNTRVNIEDLRDQNADFESTLSRKEAFASAYLLSAEDVKKVIPAQAQNWGFLGAAESMDPMYWAQQAMSAGMTDPAEVAAYVQQQMAQVFTMDEIVYGTAFTIEAGSMRRNDLDKQLDLMKEAKNTIVPLQIQSMDFDEKAVAYETLAVDAKMQGLDKRLIGAYEAMAAKFRQLALMPPSPPTAPVEGASA